MTSSACFTAARRRLCPPVLVLPGPFAQRWGAQTGLSLPSRWLGLSCSCVPSGRVGLLFPPQTGAAVTRCSTASFKSQISPFSRVMGAQTAAAGGVSKPVLQQGALKSPVLHLLLLMKTGCNAKMSIWIKIIYFLLAGLDAPTERKGFSRASGVGELHAGADPVPGAFFL